MYVHCVFEKGPPFPLLVFVRVVGFELELGKVCVFEALEHPEVHDENCLVGLLYGFFLVEMHVFEDVQGSWAEWLVHVGLHLLQQLSFAYIAKGLPLRKDISS